MTLGVLFLSSLAVGFSGAVTPGPLFVACVTQAVRGGFWAGVAVTAGHAIMELAVVLGLSWGLGTVLGRPEVAAGIGLVGGLTLMWMGYGTARGALRGDMDLPSPEHTGITAPSAAPAGRRPGWLGAVPVGMFGTVTGPYWVLWWATVGLSYLTQAAPAGALGVAAFYSGHVTADFVWYSAVAAAVAGGRRLLSVRGYRWLLAGCGLCLLALGLVFAAMGLGGINPA